MLEQSKGMIMISALLKSMHQLYKNYSIILPRQRSSKLFRNHLTHLHTGKVQLQKLILHKDFMHEKILGLAVFKGG